MHKRQKELVEAIDAVNNKLAIYEDMEKGRIRSESDLLNQLENQQNTSTDREGKLDEAKEIRK